MHRTLQSRGRTLLWKDLIPDQTKLAKHLVVKSILMSGEVIWNGGQTEIWESNKPGSKLSLIPNLANLQTRCSWKSCLSSKSSCILQIVWLKEFSPVKLWADKSAPGELVSLPGVLSARQVLLSLDSWLSRTTQQGETKDVQARGAASSEKVRPLSGRSWKSQWFKEYCGIWPKLCYV